MAVDQGENIELQRRQSLQAVIIKACAECGAPGAYHSDLSVRENWPGCWVEDHDPFNHQPVGELCPNCGADRPTNQPLGEIWYKEWWARVFTRGSR